MADGPAASGDSRRIVSHSRPRDPTDPYQSILSLTTDMSFSLQKIRLRCSFLCLGSAQAGRTGG